MNAQSRGTAPPREAAEVVTSPVRPEDLDGITFTGQSRDSLNLLSRCGTGFASSLEKNPARKSGPKIATRSDERLSPSAPSLSGLPGTGAILF